MASVRRTAVLLAAAVLLGGAAAPATADALADGGADRGVLLSLGSAVLLTGAAAATARRRTKPAGPSRPGRTDRVASAAPGDGDG
ncbi:hypothetical protein [Kitasatospora sp. CB02891]|uniref:hypothetical protein n=1 Tax=Kitasatospora sp. CB02891 TaxID=2020329 RepID=UPI000C276464|nr:hypothetical protein [Kitasatospora sp. CB02891]PJN22817.1 hypothetical protein CG736_26135 [Kitasatospora sp. CB02891]